MLNDRTAKIFRRVHFMRKNCATFWRAKQGLGFGQHMEAHYFWRKKRIAQTDQLESSQYLSIILPLRGLWISEQLIDAYSLLTNLSFCLINFSLYGCLAKVSSLTHHSIERYTAKKISSQDNMLPNSLIIRQVQAKIYIDHLSKILIFHLLLFFSLALEDISNTRDHTHVLPNFQTSQSSSKTLRCARIIS